MRRFDPEYDTPYNPDLTWTYYSISLHETAGWVNQATGLAPSQADMQAVLGSLQALRIRGEYHFGDDSSGLDEVSLSIPVSTPTPTATFTPSPTMTATPTITSTSSPQCYGDSCNGLYPQTMGCNAGAQTSLNIKPLYDISGNPIGVVENRYSTTCLSQWERARNTTVSLLWAEGSIRWGGGDYSPNLHSEDGIATFEENLYTPMYGSNAGFGPALNCGSLSTSPVNPPSQPINLNSDYGLNNCFAN